jgi:hypothetical protein
MLPKAKLTFQCRVFAGLMFRLLDGGMETQELSAGRRANAKRPLCEKRWTACSMTIPPDAGCAEGRNG